jgi:outer membrane protein OmpA-like peptidoglycan-associated protein
MENKPVFESFDEFVQFVYEANLNESADFGDLKTLLASLGLDTAGQKALARVESVVDEAKGLTQPAIYNGTVREGTATRVMGNNINKLIAYFKGKKADVDVSDAVVTIPYDNVVGGKVVTNNGERRSLVGLLADVNYLNAYNKNNGWDKPRVTKNLYWEEAAPEGKVSKVTFGILGKNAKKEGFLNGSGLTDQLVLDNNDGQLSFRVYVPGGNILPVDYTGTSKDYVTATKIDKRNETNEWVGVIAFYYVSNFIPNGGVPYKITKVAPIEILKSTTEEVFTPIVLDANALFDVDKSALKAGAENLIKIAMNGLVSASDLEVTGFASQEGTADRNKTLCEERGKVVADFIAKNYPSLGAVKVTPFDAAKQIQPAKGAEKERPNWRKVTINGKGTRVGSVPATVKEIVYKPVDNTLNADKIYVGQLLITIKAGKPQLA